jgi:uncharacterized membrane protein YhaH (DUF805 family)
MQFQDAIQSGLRNYVTFSGRAARSEFWYWTLFAFLVAAVSGILDFALFPSMGTGPLNAVTSLLLFLPGLAVSVRRLHDLDRTGWWILLTLTIIGLIVLLIWDCTKGTDGPNRFGPDPLAGAKT